nr:uncharacterized protein LOC129275678 [Lytechinus pictus]
MSSNSSCEKKLADEAGDLSSLILNGRVDKKILKSYAKNGQIDLPDKEGKTPLMIACLHGFTETVKSLLSNGADPNSRNVQDGNTPMHYACMVVGKFSRTCSRFRLVPKHRVTKLPIIKLLVSHGAETVQDNQDGWSPVCVASLYLLTDVVDFLLSQDTSSLKIKINAMEILGISQSTSDDPMTNDALQTFSKAISYRKEAGISETSTSDHTGMLSGGPVKACLTQGDLSESPMAVKGHALWLGERLFPNHLKRRYLYPFVAKFGAELMFDVCEGGSDTPIYADGFHMLSCALALERTGELKLGSVAMHLASESERVENHRHAPFYVCSDKLLGSYKSILNEVPIDSILDNLEALISSFGKILFYEAFYCCEIIVLKPILQAVEKSMKVIHGRIFREKNEKFAEMPPVTYEIMILLADAYADSEDDLPPWGPDCIKYVILKMLFYDNASYKDSHGFTLLHLVAQCVENTMDSHDILLDLTRAFVRHGCPVDVVNNMDETARGILEDVRLNTHEIDSEFLVLVSPPTTALHLEELAIRAIIRHHLNYRDMLPPSLCDMIEDGVKECEEFLRDFSY